MCCLMNSTWGLCITFGFFALGVHMPTCRQIWFPVLGVAMSTRHGVGALAGHFVLTRGSLDALPTNSLSNLVVTVGTGSKGTLEVEQKVAAPWSPPASSSKFTTDGSMEPLLHGGLLETYFSDSFPVPQRFGRLGHHAGGKGRPRRHASL